MYTKLSSEVDKLSFLYLKIWDLCFCVGESQNLVSKVFVASMKCIRNILRGRVTRTKNCMVIFQSSVQSIMTPEAALGTNEVYLISP